MRSPAMNGNNGWRVPLPAPSPIQKETSRGTGQGEEAPVREDPPAAAVPGQAVHAEQMLAEVNLGFPTPVNQGQEWQWAVPSFLCQENPGQTLLGWSVGGGEEEKWAGGCLH